MNRWGDQFGINTYSYTQAMSAADCVRMLAERGVRAIELMFFPGHLWITDRQETIRELRRAIGLSGVEVMSVNGPNVDLNIAAATSEMRDYSIRLNVEYLRLASELNAKGLIIGPGKPNPLFPLPQDVMEGHFFRALDALLPIAERVGIQLWVENMPFAFLPDAKGLMNCLDRYGADGIGVCYDVANAHFICEDPCAGFDLVHPRLRLVHLSDTGQTLYRHDPVGMGDVDFAAVTAKIKTLSPEQPLMLEIISRNADRDIARSIEALANLIF
ncbi:MAG: sugar phosphate isomerase/epimerase [Betaproteobacteria bacterium]|jgi:sugar phosphate isomerase/epimerase|nr:MAG: sugar phosphate isomerase/epimerase [Betaproteobacteria bacterium]